MKRVFKSRHFSRWMRKAGLSDKSLCHAVIEMQQGLIDADLGGGILKKRIALPGRGKSAGARTLVASRKGTKWFFVFGFEKNERANISDAELEALQGLATELLALTAKELATALNDGALEEICHDN